MSTATRFIRASAEVDVKVQLRAAAELHFLPGKQGGVELSVSITGNGLVPPQVEMRIGSDCGWLSVVCRLKRINWSDAEDVLAIYGVSETA